MKSYWYFVRRVGDFKHNDVVCKVSVGASRREQIKCALVQEFAKDCGLYFHKVDEQSDKAILLLASSLFPDVNNPLLLLRTHTLSICELYSRIVDDAWSDIENDAAIKQGFFQLISIFDPRYYLNPSQIPSITACPSGKRKNLSTLMSNDCVRAVLCVTGLMFLMMADSIVSLLCGFD